MKITLFWALIAACLFTRSVSDESTTKDEVMYLNSIPNYDLDKSYNFYFYASEVRNNTNLLVRIIEFCIQNEMDPMTYQNMFDQVHKIAKKDEVSTELFSLLDSEIKHKALDLLHQKYKYPFTKSTTKSISSTSYWKNFCGLTKGNEYHTDISKGHITSLREMFPMVIANLNREFQENRYQIADTLLFPPEVSIPEYWSNILEDAISRKADDNAIHNWVDESLCIRIMLNRTFDDTMEPPPDTSKRVQTKACRGSLESYSYSPLSYFFSLRLQANYKLRYVSDSILDPITTTTTTFQENVSELENSDSSEPTTNTYSDNSDNNVLGSYSVHFKKTKPLIVISAYEYYIVENLTHLFDAFELTWSFIAFLKKNRQELSPSFDSFHENNKVQIIRYL